MAKKNKSLSEAVSSELKKGFDLNGFKAKKGLNSSVKFKDQEWIPLSKAFQDVTSVPGIPLGHISILRGHSDTGKTTALLEAAVAAQKRGIMPVFIITEMKWSWEHAQMMGLEVEEVVAANHVMVEIVFILIIEDILGHLLVNYPQRCLLRVGGLEHFLKRR